MFSFHEIKLESSLDNAHEIKKVQRWPCTSTELFLILMHKSWRKQKINFMHEQKNGKFCWERTYLHRRKSKMFLDRKYKHILKMNGTATPNTFSNAKLWFCSVTSAIKTHYKGKKRFCFTMGWREKTVSLQ